MSAHVRVAVAADRDAVVELTAVLGYRLPAAQFDEQFTVHLTSPSARIFVAEAADGELVGMLSACCLPLLHVGWMGRISALSVAAHARRQALGKALMLAAEAWVAEHGCRRFEVTSNVRRLDAHAFYESLGYTLQSKRFIKDPPA